MRALLFKICTEKLVGDLRFEGLGGVDELLDFGLGGDAAGEMFLLVDFEHLLCEVVGAAGREFLYGVHAGGFKQLGELGTYTMDAEEVSMVDPCEDEFVRNAGGFFEFCAAFRASAAFEQLIDCEDACSNEFFAVDGADALDVFDFVGHNIK